MKFTIHTRHNGFHQQHDVWVDKDNAFLLRGYAWDIQHSDPDHSYVFRQTPNGRVYLHHTVLGSAKRTYHKNGNGLDNRRVNLTHKDTGIGCRMRAFYRLFEKEPVWR